MTCRASVSGSGCQEGTDPRRAGTCVRCGRAIPQPESRERDVQLERDITLQAAKVAGVDPWPLIRFSESRIADGPIDLPRDWDREFLEEMSDARNYSCWAIAELQMQGDPEDELPKWEQRLIAVLQIFATLG